MGFQAMTWLLGYRYTLGVVVMTASAIALSRAVL